MQLVVEISEDTFFDLKKKQNRTEVDNAVINGTPLPKGHGRLIDADELYGDFIDGTESYDCQAWNRIEIGDIIEDAPTIIEADKGYEVEVITRGNCMMCGKELTEGLFFCKECEAKVESDIEKRKPCDNYEDGCEEWAAGCPCVYYKAESEESE